METSDQNAMDGFSFSQDLTSGLSQMYSQMSQSTDSGFYGDSQSLKDSQSLSQSFGGMGAVHQKRPFFDQMVPPSFPVVKKAKYNLPKWTKGLLKTAEETQKLKSHDDVLRRQEEENGQLRFFVQDVQKSIGGIPELLAQMIKESTDFLDKNFEKRNADLKIELSKDLNDALEKEMSSLKKQHLDNIFDTWNYLSEIKTTLGEIQNMVSDDLKNKIETCCKSIVKAQQKMEEKSSEKIGNVDEKNQGYKNKLEENKQNFRQIGNMVENEQNFCQTEMENKNDSLDGLLESDDEFQVSVGERVKSRESPKIGNMVENRQNFRQIGNVVENKQNFRQIGNLVENKQTFCQTEMENKKDSLDGLLESDDDFQVSIGERIKSRRRSKKKLTSELPALPKPTWTSTPIHAPMPSFYNRQRKLVDDEEMYKILFNVEP